MPKVSPIQANFNGGELGPLAQGRVDADRYKQSLDTCLNLIPAVQGPLTARPGFKYVAAVKSSSVKCRLVPFEFSTTQAYILEFGNLYVRFYKDNGQIESGGSPVEVVTPYAEADLFQLKFTQSADTLYITHPSYAPRKLTRTSHTAWTLTEINFIDGPWLAVNATATTMTPSATTGAGITITASAAAFASTDVGRLIRIRHGGTWGHAKIVGYTSTTVVTADVATGYGFAATTASATWRLGVFSATTGYPACSTFHEDRLYFAGATNNPQRVDGSSTSNYEDFAPSDTVGAVTDANAVSFTINANDVNVIRWIRSEDKGMMIGTVGGEWMMEPASTSSGITPTNVSVKRVSNYGSANVEPIGIGKATIFVQRAQRKLHELIYFYDVDGYRAPDLTQIADHVTKTGVTQMAFQKQPQPILWFCRTDGVLVGMTYDRDLDNVKVGFSRHIVGGYVDAANNDAVVESVACIPSADGTRNELWIIVKRYINGATARYVEYGTQLFDDTVDLQDAFFVDSGLTYDAPKTITGITKANPAVVTSASHGFSNGDRVQILNVQGMTEVNDEVFTIANVATNTFELSGINSTNYTTYVSGGEARKLVSTISGLSHLEGQTVSVLGDGAVQPSKTVSGGSISLTTPAATVQVGLAYNMRGKMLRIDAGAADGTAHGKTRRINRVAFDLYRTVNLKIGFSFDDMDRLVFRTAGDSLSRAVPLYTGIFQATIEGDYSTEEQICFEQDQPLPLTVRAIMPQMTTQDR